MAVEEVPHGRPGRIEAEALEWYEYSFEEDEDDEEQEQEEEEDSEEEALVEEVNKDEEGGISKCRVARLSP
jgi:hypothetical protein